MFDTTARERGLAATSRILTVFSMWAALSAPCRAEPRAAVELESRLFAPCCYTQTLDVHESEIATTLRREIRERLAAGEPADRIEDDLAQHFGERIRAVPRGSDPRRAIPALIAVAMSTSFAALLWFGMGWRRRSASSTGVALPAQETVRLDAELDAELARGRDGELACAPRALTAKDRKKPDPSRTLDP